MFSKEYILGLFFILLVALIWAASSVVAQLVYASDSFDSPFLLTYIGTSLFTLWLPVKFSTKWFMAVDPRHPNSEENALMTDTSYRSVEGTEMYSPVDTDTRQAIPTDDSTWTTTHPEAPMQAVIQEVWNNDDHLRVAFRIAPVWFIANWSYNASLLYTTITSSTVLASTSSLFTFMFAVLCKDESFSFIRLSGVLLGVSGGILTALHDASGEHKDDDNRDVSGDLALLGDILGLVSAVGYGGYAVQTRVYCPKDESLYSMQLILGYIGLLNMTFLSPIAIYLIVTSGHLQWLVIGAVFFKGLFDNFLSDYLWLRAVLLTNATVATVGLALTIPLAFGSDLFMGKLDVLSAPSVFGAVAVLLGFFFVNVGNDGNDEMGESGNFRENQEQTNSSEERNEEWVVALEGMDD